MNDDEYPDVLAYVRASVDLAEKKSANTLHVKLCGDLYAGSMPRERTADRTPSAGEVEGGNRTAADDVSACRLRDATELPATESRVPTGAGEGDQAQGSAEGAARDGAASGELESEGAVK